MCEWDNDHFNGVWLLWRASGKSLHDLYGEYLHLSYTSVSVLDVRNDSKLLPSISLVKLPNQMYWIWALGIEESLAKFQTFKVQKVSFIFRDLEYVKDLEGSQT